MLSFVFYHLVSVLPVGLLVYSFICTHFGQSFLLLFLIGTVYHSRRQQNKIFNNQQH